MFDEVLQEKQSKGVSRTNDDIVNTAEGLDALLRGLLERRRLPHVYLGKGTLLACGFSEFLHRREAFLEPRGQGVIASPIQVESENTDFRPTI